MERLIRFINISLAILAMLCGYISITFLGVDHKSYAFRIEHYLQSIPPSYNLHDTIMICLALSWVLATATVTFVMARSGFLVALKFSAFTLFMAVTCYFSASRGEDQLALIPLGVSILCLVAATAYLVQAVRRA